MIKDKFCQNIFFTKSFRFSKQHQHYYLIKVSKRVRGGRSKIVEWTKKITSSDKIHLYFSLSLSLNFPIAKLVYLVLFLLVTFDILNFSLNENTISSEIENNTLAIILAVSFYITNTFIVVVVHLINVAQTYTPENLDHSDDDDCETMILFIFCPVILFFFFIHVWIVP